MTEPDIMAGLPAGVPGALAEHLASLPLVDNHVHGYTTAAMSRADFELALNEGSLDPVPAFMTQFDSQLGFALRRWCPVRLGLPAHTEADEYWRHRSALPLDEVAGAMLSGAGVERWIVDTGFASDQTASPTELARVSGTPSSEILRLEFLAERLLASGSTATSFADDFGNALRARGDAVVGFKTIAAYRTGFDIDWSRPGAAQLEAAVSAWIESGRRRLDDPVIISFIVHAAADLRMPVQFHVGFGDRDMDLHRSDPLLLLGLLRQPSMAGTPIVLLHCYPYHREAGYLAQAFDDVYFDVGLALHFVGSQSVQLVRESLELAPFAKILYSSDAYALPELHLLGSVLWRRAMAEALGGWVAAGEWSLPDAIRVAGMIGNGNSRRVYGV
ncbi:amidohydrolase family protein [Compostimonas suwonensis]|uniref:Amidohydrolase-related domain-containing protein n=1 Tax=Compostimonas suwonensis TaxID=1048394 RepID=A0A2M9BUS2_9MICO|nr:amidohydrolase family protein [Compostimonas suwonensis]PJJ61701.1 hypothetical protein CLV54_2651 [Compostimonas suwonensis]